MIFTVATFQGNHKIWKCAQDVNEYESAHEMCTIAPPETWFDGYDEVWVWTSVSWFHPRTHSLAIMLQGGFGDFYSIFLAEGRVRLDQCGRVGLQKTMSSSSWATALNPCKKIINSKIARQNSPARTPKNRVNLCQYSPPLQFLLCQQKMKGAHDMHGCFL
jgi:hypothetical protein